MAYIKTLFLVLSFSSLVFATKFSNIQFIAPRLVDTNRFTGQDWSKAATWLAASKSCVVKEYFQPNVSVESYMYIMQAQPTNQFFFVAFSVTGTGIQFHLISELNSDALPNKVKDGATKYLDFFGDEFVRGFFEITIGKQMFTSDDAAQVNRMTLAAKLPGTLGTIKTLANAPKKFGEPTSVYAYPNLWQPRTPYLDVSFGFSDKIILYQA